MSKKKEDVKNEDIEKDVTCSCNGEDTCTCEGECHCDNCNCMYLDDSAQSLSGDAAI